MIIFAQDWHQEHGSAELTPGQNFQRYLKFRQDIIRAQTEQMRVAQHQSHPQSVSHQVASGATPGPPRAYIRAPPGSAAGPEGGVPQHQYALAPSATLPQFQQASAPPGQTMRLTADANGQLYIVISNPGSAPVFFPADAAMLQRVGITRAPSSYPGISLPGNQAEVPEAEPDEFEESPDEQSYLDYSPHWFKLGQPHPDPLVQSGCMGAVLPPPIEYKLALPAQVCGVMC